MDWNPTTPNGQPTDPISRVVGDWYDATHGGNMDKLFRTGDELVEIVVKIRALYDDLEVALGSANDSEQVLAHVRWAFDRVPIRHTEPTHASASIDPPRQDTGSTS